MGPSARESFPGENPRMTNLQPGGERKEEEEEEEWWGDRERGDIREWCGIGPFLLPPQKGPRCDLGRLSKKGPKVHQKSPFLEKLFSPFLKDERDGGGDFAYNFKDI